MEPAEEEVLRGEISIDELCDWIKDHGDKFQILSVAGKKSEVYKSFGELFYMAPDGNRKHLLKERFVCRLCLLGLVAGTHSTLTK